MTTAGMEILQEAAETHLVHHLCKAYTLTYHRKAKTLDVKDMDVLKMISTMRPSDVVAPEVPVPPRKRAKKAPEPPRTPRTLS